MTNIKNSLTTKSTSTICGRIIIISLVLLLLSSRSATATTSTSPTTITTAFTIVNYLSSFHQNNKIISHTTSTTTTANALFLGGYHRDDKNNNIITSNNNHHCRRRRHRHYGLISLIPKQRTMGLIEELCMVGSSSSTITTTDDKNNSSSRHDSTTTTNNNDGNHNINQNDDNKEKDAIGKKDNNDDDDDEEDELLTREGHNLRFSGVGRLYSQPSPQSQTTTTTTTTSSITTTINERLRQSTVAVIGIGGVGSWAAEALCRSGIGSLILIDMDDICISNTNRQLHALSSTVGQSKIDEMKKRLLDINPYCRVTTVFDFISTDNVHSTLQNLHPRPTVVLDAIDGKFEKASLIAACVELSFPIVTCGAAAGRIDPTKIIYDDLTRSKEDRLLFKVKKELRRKFHFAKGPGKSIKNNHNPRKWNIGAVFSTEVVDVVPTPSSMSSSSSFRLCDGGTLGTACFVTGTYGFVAAGRIVEMIAKDELVIPKKNRQQQSPISPSSPHVEK